MQTVKNYLQLIWAITQWRTAICRSQIRQFPIRVKLNDVILAWGCLDFHYHFDCKIDKQERGHSPMVTTQYIDCFWLPELTVWRRSNGVYDREISAAKNQTRSDQVRFDNELLECKFFGPKIRTPEFFFLARRHSFCLTSTGRNNRSTTNCRQFTYSQRKTSFIAEIIHLASFPPCGLASIFTIW